MRAHQLAQEYLAAGPDGGPVKFRHRGRSIYGLDCVGLLVLVGQRLGLDIQDLKIYGREPTGGQLRDYLVKNLGEPKPTLELAIDDAVLMQLPGQAENGHAGIVAPHPHGLGIVHTYAELGRVVYQRIDGRRRQQIKEVYTWPARD